MAKEAKRPHHWDCERILLQMKSWLEHPSNKRLLYDQRVDDIKQAIESRDPNRNALLASRLHGLSVWYATLGAFTVGIGNDAGWSDLIRAIKYEGWHLKILLRLFDEDPRRNKPARADSREAAHCIVRALALRQFEIAEWCGARLRKSLDDSAFYRMGRTPFEPFVLRLYCLWKDVESDFSTYELPPLGPYDAIFDEWNATERLSPALVRICEYHCSRSHGGNDVDLPEFAFDFDAAMPNEVLAIQRVRELKGLPTPIFRHKLLATRFANVPDTIDGEEDDLLNAVIESIRRDLPGIEAW